VKLPRVRFTVRRLMIAVPAVALVALYYAASGFPSTPRSVGRRIERIERVRTERIERVRTIFRGDQKRSRGGVMGKGRERENEGRLDHDDIR
jgi:hypothetical protein